MSEHNERKIGSCCYLVLSPNYNTFIHKYRCPSVECRTYWEDIHRTHIKDKNPEGSSRFLARRQSSRLLSVVKVIQGQVRLAIRVALCHRTPIVNFLEHQSLANVSNRTRPGQRTPEYHT